jgi:hypothetical protein
MNTIPEIAGRLASLCNELKFVEAYTELFADHAVSIDPNNKNEPLTGLDNLIEYEKRFLVSVNIQNVKVSDAIFAGSYFSLIFSMHFTIEEHESKTVEEICVYKVENGKIVSQQFFIG